MDGNGNIGEIKSQLIERLILLSKRKAFLALDEIIDHASAVDLPLDELDRICEILLDAGVLIQLDTEDAEHFEKPKLSISIDRSHLDYDYIFNRAIEIDPALQAYITEVRRIPAPQTNEERRLVIQAQEGNAYAKDRVINMFLKIVVRISLWYYDRYSLPLRETIQDGNVGLVLALEKMPKTPDYRFSAYAPWWVRQVIERSAGYGFCDSFYVPVHLKDKLFKVHNIKKMHKCHQCSQYIICPNLTQKVSRKLSVEKDVADLYIRLLNEPLSIEEYVYDLEQEEIFRDDGDFDEMILDRVAYQTIAQKIQQILSELNPRESDVLHRRYGFGEFEPSTLEEIAKSYGVTRERVRQIESNAKLRLEKFKRVLKHYR